MVPCALLHATILLIGTQNVAGTLGYLPPSPGTPRSPRLRPQRRKHRSRLVCDHDRQGRERGVHPRVLSMDTDAVTARVSRATTARP